MNERAGKFVLTPEGYRSFIPRELPPEPPIQYDDEMQLLLSKADRDLARLPFCACSAMKSILIYKNRL